VGARGEGRGEGAGARGGEGGEGGGEGEGAKGEGREGERGREREEGSCQVGGGELAGGGTAQADSSPRVTVPADVFAERGPQPLRQWHLPAPVVPAGNHSERLRLELRPVCLPTPLRGWDPAVAPRPGFKTSGLSRRDTTTHHQQHQAPSVLHRPRRLRGDTGHQCTRGPWRTYSGLRESLFPTGEDTHGMPVSGLRSSPGCSPQELDCRA